MGATTTLPAEFECSDTVRHHLKLVPSSRVTYPPKSGLYHVIKEAYWVVYDGHIIIYRRSAPQCNKNESVTRQIRDNLYPNSDVQYFEAVFLPCNESVEIEL